jgi:hypothetical protein
MGTILASYGDDAYDHEGYAAQLLDDGSLTGTYSNDTEPRMVGQVVAACGCGWTGTTRYPTTGPFDEAAHDLALAEWERDHARPTLQGLQVDHWDRLPPWCASSPSRTPPPPARGLAACPRSSSGNCWTARAPCCTTLSS